MYLELYETVEFTNFFTTRKWGYVVTKVMQPDLPCLYFQFLCCHSALDNIVTIYAQR